MPMTRKTAGDGSAWAGLPPAREAAGPSPAGAGARRAASLGRSWRGVWGAPSRARRGGPVSAPEPLAAPGWRGTRTRALSPRRALIFPGFSFPPGRHGIPNLFAEKTLGKRHFILSAREERPVPGEGAARATAGGWSRHRASGSRFGAPVAPCALGGGCAHRCRHVPPASSAVPQTATPTAPRAARVPLQVLPARRAARQPHSPPRQLHSGGRGRGLPRATGMGGGAEGRSERSRRFPEAPAGTAPSRLWCP